MFDNLDNCTQNCSEIQKINSLQCYILFNIFLLQILLYLSNSILLRLDPVYYTWQNININNIRKYLIFAQFTTDNNRYK